jgi:hypothetical protein
VIAMTELEELRAWLVDVLADDRTRFELLRRGIGTAERCGVFCVQPLADVGRLSEDIIGRAMRDARHFRGEQSYIVVACKDDTGKGAVQTVIEVAGGRDVDERGVDIEHANSTGLLGQLMRHNESDQKSISGQFSAVFAAYEQLLAARDRIIEQRDKRIAELEARELKVFEMYERLSAADHERNVEIHRLDQQDKRTEYAVQKLDLLLPIIGSKVGARFLGDGHGGSLPLFGEEMLRQFLRSLDDAQVANIVSSLRPEQAAIVGELYLAYAEREKISAGEGATTSGPTTGRAAAAGSTPPSARTEQSGTTGGSP